MVIMHQEGPIINVSIDIRDPTQLNACSICMGSLISDKRKCSAKCCRGSMHTNPPGDLEAELEMRDFECQARAD